MKKKRYIITLFLIAILILFCYIITSSIKKANDKEDNSIVTNKNGMGDTKKENSLNEVSSNNTNGTHKAMACLPESILNEVAYQQTKYDIEIAVGIYSLDGEKGYVYNELQPISGGCTIKAVYALYVLKESERLGIDISTYTLTYEEGMLNKGTGCIKFAEYGTDYTIDYLLNRLLVISDNTAYNILVSGFPLSRFREFLQSIDGQILGDELYGKASVVQRKNEWLEIYKYVNSDNKYSAILKSYITDTPYCYITDLMKENHTYMHKSGWSDTLDYTCACDCAIIDDSYLLIIMTQDYSTGIAHIDTVESIGASVEEYINSGGKLF